MQALLRDDHQTLKKELKSTPKAQLYLLQARSNEQEKWRFVYKKQAIDSYSHQLYLDFMSIKELTEFYKNIRQEEFEYRIVHILTILPDGLVKPIVRESVLHFPKTRCR